MASLLVVTETRGEGVGWFCGPCLSVGVENVGLEGVERRLSRGGQAGSRELRMRLKTALALYSRAAPFPSVILGHNLLSFPLQGSSPTAMVGALPLPLDHTCSGF